MAYTGKAIDNLIADAGVEQVQMGADVSSNQEPAFRFCRDVRVISLMPGLRSLQGLAGAGREGLTSQCRAHDAVTQKRPPPLITDGWKFGNEKFFTVKAISFVQSKSYSELRVPDRRGGPFVTRRPLVLQPLWLFQGKSPGHIRKLFSVTGAECLFKRAGKPVSAIEAMRIQFFLRQAMLTYRWLIM
jgi:hypothetical protein